MGGTDTEIGVMTINHGTQPWQSAMKINIRRPRG